MISNEGPLVEALAAAVALEPILRHLVDLHNVGTQLTSQHDLYTEDIRGPIASTVSIQSIKSIAI